MRYIYKILPGQMTFPLQGTTSTPFPEQGKPFPSGAGLLHTRCLVFSPSK